MANTVLLIITILVGILAVVIMYIKVRSERPDKQLADKMTFDRLVEIVKVSLADLVKEDTLSGYGSDEEFEALYQRKAKIDSAMRNCVYGIDSEKQLVKGLIRSIIATTLPTIDDILVVKDFYSQTLPPAIKFEILMHFYKREHGKDALAVMIEEYHLDRERYIIEDKTEPSYAITREDINRVYADKNFPLTYDDMIDVLTTLVYQKYKGFGVIDTVREMNINGINCGVSGSVLANIGASNVSREFQAPRSVWLYHKGKYIHLRFLTFHSEEELRRVIQLIIRYNSPGPLTEKRGYVVTTMYDKSRVLAMRPPMGEYWAVFIRKFTLPNASMEYLLNPQQYINGVPTSIYHNWELPYMMIKYFMIGKLSGLFTGRQGSGKTTLMIGAVKFVDPRYNLRIAEMTFEMYLREVYPERNIFSAQETPNVSVEAIQDAFKKSDGAVQIVGEIATAPIASRFIQSGLAASEFTFASHHGVSTEKALQDIRNKLVDDAGYTMDTASEQVLDVVKYDVHLDYDTEGHRFVDRITVVIRIDEQEDYPEIDENDPYSFQKIMREYFIRCTDRKKFITRDIIRFNRDTLTYEPCKEFLPTDMVEYMLKSMPARHRKEFIEFAQKYWQNLRGVN